MSTEVIETPFGMGTLQKIRIRVRREMVLFYRFWLDLPGSQGLTQNTRVLTLKVWPDGRTEVLMPQGITVGLALLNWLYNEATLLDA